MFLDADDILGPDVIKSLEAQLKKNPEGIVACPWYRLEKNDKKWYKRPISCLPLRNNQDNLSGWLSGWWLPPCSILWSMAAYKRAGGWDPNTYVNDDGELIMRALIKGIKLELTDEGASFYRRLPPETVTKSLSGQRFTRKGCKSEIYVIKKIASSLDQKNVLDKYRKPLTIAIDKIRSNCNNQYPDLENECFELIEKFGEPYHVRYIRMIGEEFHHVAYQGFNRSARTLTYLGMSGIRLKLSKFKNNISLSKSRSKEETKNSSGNDQQVDAEISYGMTAYRHAMRSKVNGDL